MITVRKSTDRGFAKHDWLQSYHTFSFAGYQDPRFMGFRSLRVINQDSIAGGQGFGMHSHRDMEIITYMLSGSLKHRDSLGNEATIEPGEIQRMSAGTGITHSEFNANATGNAQLLQIWIEPDRVGIDPSYEQKLFTSQEKLNHLRLIVAPEAENGSLKIHQNARIYASILTDQTTINHKFAPDRFGWLQLISGTLLADNFTLEPGDAIAIADLAQIELTALTDSEFLLFDLL